MLDNPSESLLAPLLRGSEVGHKPHASFDATNSQGTSTAAPSSLPSAQIVERLVGLVERIGRGRRSHLRLRRERQKFATVGAGQIGDRGDAALLPQQADKGTRGCRSCGCRRRRRGRPCAMRQARPGRARRPARTEWRRRAARAACRPIRPPSRRPSSARTPDRRSSPGRVKANTRRPCQRQTWAMMCPAAPKP